MSTQPGQQTDFGANEWLVYEIHQQYLKDPESVSEAWREFLSDYDPSGADTGNGQASGGSNGTPPPASAQIAARNATEDEAKRETLETVRSISRLEESN